MRTCPNPECGTQNTDEARFCVVCGTRLAATQPTPPPLEPTVPLPAPTLPPTIIPPAQQPTIMPPAQRPIGQLPELTPAPQNQWGSPAPASQEPKKGGIPIWLILSGVGLLLLLCVGGGVGAYALVNAANASTTATAVAAANADSTATARTRATAAARTATAEARATSQAEVAVAEAETATAEAELAIAEAETATAEAAAAVELPTEEAATPVAGVTDNELAPLQASFSDNEGWYIENGDEVEWLLADGAYRFNIKAPEQIAWDEFDTKPASDDYLVRVRGRVRENVGGMYVVFNFVNSENFYAFGISSDGQYRLTARENGALLDENIIDWKNSDAIQQGNEAENELEVVRRGALMELYINGQRVEIFEDARFSGGYAGVGAESYDKTGSVVDIITFSISPLAVSDFETAGNPERWSEEDTDVVHSEIEGTTLAMTIKVGDSSAYANRRVAALPTDNFILQADMASIESPDDVAGGIYFNYDNASENFYRVLVWSGGQYLVVWVKDKEYETLVDWTDDSNIKPGSEVNQVRVERVGSSMLIWINGAFVKQVDDLTLTGGSVGVGVGSFKTGTGGKVLFDNVVMGALP